MQRADMSGQTRPSTAMLHYTSPPVIGGVEAVVRAHAGAFVRAQYAAAVVAGRGLQCALPHGAGLVLIPEMDSQHPQIAELSAHLEHGDVPSSFDEMVDRLEVSLTAALSRFDVAIVHNVFTKHFNLPLTAALCRMLDGGTLKRCIAWCHDFTWTSDSSRSKVHEGYPWQLLRSYREDLTYVVVSARRQRELARLLGCPLERIHVVHNGVQPSTLLGLSPESEALVDRLGVLASDLILLMPVRVTRAKNIEFALQVAAELKGRGCRPKLVVTGPPDPHDARSMAYFGTLQEMRRQLEIEDEVCFVYQSGPNPEEPFTLTEDVVGDLYRVSDIMFMPSHREGFGMPVLEAGMVGLPVVCTDVPAAEEIGGMDVTTYDAGSGPGRLAEQLLEWTAEDPVHRLRRRVRQQYTWDAVFQRAIKPLLDGGGEAPR